MATGGSLESRELFVKCIGECGGDVEALQSVFSSAAGNDQDKKSILEQAFRDALSAIVQSSLPSVEDTSRLTDLIVLSIGSAQAGICYHTVPFILCGDILDCVTLDVCKEVFVFLENQVSTWTQPEFYTAGKNLLLRMCNDLLRRLSSAQNTVFCGRIQLFLARFFPLSEKSALNLMSHFNLENITTYNKSAGMEGGEEQPSQGEGTEKKKTKKKKKKKEEEEGEEEGGEEDMEVDDGRADGLEDLGAPIDYNLYHKLWAVQDSFRCPTQCYSSEHWKVLMTNVQDILQAFSSYKLEDVSRSSGKNKRKRKRAEAQPSSSSSSSSVLQQGVSLEYTESHSFAKFLTSEKLMNLQLRDSHFRRHILIQLLVLFQYLLGNVKFKPPSHIISEAQNTWIHETTDKVYKLIEETPPNGTDFAVYVRQVLQREEARIAWKNDGCHSFERPPVSSTNGETEPRPKKRHLGDSYAQTPRKIDLGSTELSRLWNLCPDNLEACRMKNRIFVPDASKFLEEPIEQADPEAKIEAEFKVINNPNFAWRCLRLLSQTSPHFFQNTTAQIRPLPEYIEHVIVKTGEELKSTSSTG